MPIPPPHIEEIDVAVLRDGLQEIRDAGVKPSTCDKFEQLLAAYCYLTTMVLQMKVTMKQLRRWLSGFTSEKTHDVLNNNKPTPPTDQDSAPGESQAPSANNEGAEPKPEDAESKSEGAEPESEGAEPEPEDAEPEGAEPEDAESESKPKTKGHGRHAAADYHGAQQVYVPHPSLQPGDRCPDCDAGTLYDTGRPGILIRLTGQAPVLGSVYRLQKLRCKLCGAVFRADLPEQAGSQKYTPTARSIIPLLKYGTGMPYNRAENLQGMVGIPLAASTQWDICRSLAAELLPVLHELIRQAAQGEVLFHDDTGNKILEWMGKKASKRPLLLDTNGRPRTGTFTSGIVSLHAGYKIVLFFTGQRHAGENLVDVLAHRAADLDLPIQMCDALARNMPSELRTILANCLTHARRKFVDITDDFYQECRYVLEALKEVYHNDAQARQQQLTPQQRLELHQSKSKPVMDELQKWLQRQLDEHLVEPNSGLGAAISYMLRHWEPLTLFLRKAGAPLDNNICERCLKLAILHRKNSLFYKTAKGAAVGDLFMSLIYTCHLCGANPMDYLTQLQIHIHTVSANPKQWMPWNYHQQVDDSLTWPPAASQRQTAKTTLFASPL